MLRGYCGEEFGECVMRLSLENVGKIDTAAIEIDGITVIAGENNTGKSTVGRALFVVFNGFYDIEEKIKAERVRSVRELLNSVYYMRGSSYFAETDLGKTAGEIVDDINVYKGNSDAVQRKLMSLTDKPTPKSFDKICEGISARISEILSISDTDLFETILMRSMNNEFSGQVGNVFREGESKISLEIANQCLELMIMNNETVKIKRPDDMSLQMETVYIDDPFVMDEARRIYSLREVPYLDHRSHLRNKLSHVRRDIGIIDEIVVDKKLRLINEKLSSVCSGDIISNKRAGLVYKVPNSDKELEVGNLSTGLKTFAILKVLLQNGTIRPNGTIILDEPEIHLHPEWQLLFAELIVLLHKEFKLHILLNTHSPYFLRAVQVYSARYEVADKCKYYLSDVKNGCVIFTDVTDEIDKIYVKLSRPLQRLENERWEDD